MTDFRPIRRISLMNDSFAFDLIIDFSFTQILHLQHKTFTTLKVPSFEHNILNIIKNYKIKNQTNKKTPNTIQTNKHNQKFLIQTKTNTIHIKITGFRIYG